MRAACQIGREAVIQCELHGAYRPADLEACTEDERVLSRVEAKADAPFGGLAQISREEGMVVI